MTHDIQVVVADDHPVFLDGLVATIGRADGIRVAGVAHDSAAAVVLVAELHPDIALLDLGIAGGGLAAAHEIARSTLATRVVVLTASENQEDMLEALSAGARGYILKGVSGDEIVRILRSIHAGEVYAAPTVAWGTIRGMARSGRSVGIDELTAREYAVLELVARGLGNAEIGSHLSIAEKTVKTYMTSIFSKLGLETRVEAALLAARAGLGQGSSGDAASGRRPVPVMVDPEPSVTAHVKAKLNGRP